MTADAAAGPQPALDEFWKAYTPHLRKRACYLLEQARIPNGRLDVDDVMQSVYELLWVNWETVRNPVAYARSRAAVVVFEQLRDERRYGPSLNALTDAQVEFADDVPSVDEILVEEEQQAQLAVALPAALDQLTDHQREAISLCDEQGLTREEAARRMQIKAGTVHSHRGRAIAKLRMALTAEPETLMVGILLIILAGLGTAVLAIMGLKFRDAVLAVGTVAGVAGAVYATSRIRERNSRLGPGGGAGVRRKTRAVLRWPMLRPVISLVLTAPLGLLLLLGHSAPETVGLIAGLLIVVDRYLVRYVLALLRHLFAVERPEDEFEYPA